MNEFGRFVVLFVTLLWIFAVPVTAAHYVAATAGSGGPDDAESGGLEFGWILERMRWGFGASLLNNGYPVPIDVENASKKVEDEGEIYGLIGVALARRFTIAASLGASEHDTVTKYFTTEHEEREYKFFATASGQLVYTEDRFTAGVGYHNRRGPFLKLGVVF